MIFVESTWDCTVAGIAGQSLLKALSFKTLNSMRLRETRHPLPSRPAEVRPVPSGGLRNDLAVLSTNEMILPPARF